MGNTSQNQKNQLLSKLRFIETINDQNFGSVKIYRKQQFNFEYIMVIDKFTDLNTMYNLKSQIQTIMISSLMHKQSLFLKIYHYQIIEKNYTKCNIPVFRLHVEYYNYTLDHLYTKRCNLGQYFTYDEILYILNCSLAVYQVLLDINPSNFTCSMNSIFITPQGTLKFSPIKIQLFNQDQNVTCSKFCNKIQSQQYHSNIYFNHNQLILQVKKLLLLLTRLPKRKYNNMNEKRYDYHQFKKIQSDITNSKNFNQIKKIIPISKSDSLKIKFRQIQTIERNITTENSPVAQNKKLQIKKSMKKIGYK